MHLQNQEAEADSSQKEHIDTAEVSESTQEIQNLEECSLREMDMKVTVKTDANIEETNEDVEQGLHMPEERVKPAGPAFDESPTGKND